MTQPVMRRCPACREYTLSESCPRCAERAVDPRPAKFSPEDPYGVYRRRLKRLASGTGPAQGGNPGGTAMEP